MGHERFSYKNIADIRLKLEEIGESIPLSDHVQILTQEYELCGKMSNNRIVYQPMEGCDCAEDGGPGELTNRRYERFAHGGPGIIWFEAAAIVPEGRAQKRQLFINNDNIDSYKKVVERIKAVCMKVNRFEPLIILQAAHSGRYSKPNGVPEPIIACNSPLFETDMPIDKSRIISDSRLQELECIFGDVAKLAELAGFDGIDIKACHRYMASELLSAFSREGPYGGCFNNRTRFLINNIKSAQAAVNSSFIVTTRLNIYDGFPYPYGFGVAANGGITPDLSEPMELVGRLYNELNINLINLTMGNPYVNPHVNRPFDKGTYIPDEHPLTGVSRIMKNIGKIQQAFPALKVVCSGLSYLRQFSPNLAAGMLENGYAGLAGFGRESLADPDFAREIRTLGCVNVEKVCLTCGQCALRLRAGMESGCVIRDNSIYKQI